MMFHQTDFYLFPVTAHEPADLLNRLEQLSADLDQTDDVAPLARRWLSSYTASRFTLAIVGGDKAALAKQIKRARSGVVKAFEQAGEWKSPLGSYFTVNPLGREGDIAFVYPGAMNSYIGLGRDLFKLFPNLREKLDDISGNVAHVMRESLLHPPDFEQLSKAELQALEAQLLADPIAMLETGSSLTILYTKILQDYFGVQPQAAFGYSLGEGSMLWSLGVWTDGALGSRRLNDSALLKHRLNGEQLTLRQFWNIPPHAPLAEALWHSYGLSASPDAVRQALQGEPRVYLTLINTPNEVVIAGEPASCRRVIDKLGCAAIQAPLNLLIHCEPMQAEHSSFKQFYQLPTHEVRGIKFYSAAEYRPIPLESERVADSIATMLCQPVDFPRLLNRVYGDGARIFVELGPGRTCTRWISDNLADRAHTAIAINKKGTPDHVSIVRLLARLISHGVPLDLSPLTGQVKPKTAVAPSHAAEGQRPPVSAPPVQPMPAPSGPLTPFQPDNLEAGGPVSSSATLTPLSQRDPFNHYHQVQANNRLAAETQVAFLSQRQTALQQMGTLIGAYLDGVAHDVAPPVARSAAAPPKPPAVLSAYQLREFATGSLVTCFGPDYQVYEQKRGPRIPNGRLQLISRVMAIRAKRGLFEPSSSLVAEYDLRADNPFFQPPPHHNQGLRRRVSTGSTDGFRQAYVTPDYHDRRHDSFAYFAAMEIVLQACGTLSVYLGAALPFPEEDFYYRNLDGRLHFLKELPPRDQTVTSRVQLISSTTIQGIIIEKYGYALHDEPGDLILEGETTFGYFNRPALANQVGLVGQPFYDAATLAQGEPFPFRASQGRSVEAAVLDLLDRVTIMPTGGAYQQGYVFAQRQIQPDDWYFANHFYQDPVMPGSLGIEAILQAMQAYAIQQKLDQPFAAARFGQATTHQTTWQYRGQIVPENSALLLEVHIKRVEQTAERVTIMGDASLWKVQPEGGLMRIYAVTDAAICLMEGGHA